MSGVQHRSPVTLKSASRSPHSVQRNSRAQSITGTGAVLRDLGSDVGLGAELCGKRSS
jgi:hypothetical protein